MITWWDFPTHLKLVYLFTFSQSWFKADSYPDNSNPPYTCKDYIIYSMSSSYYLVHLLLTIPVSCNQDSVIPVLPIHNFIECVTGTFNRVTIHDSIQDSIILDILSSSFHEIPEFSFCDPLRVFFTVNWFLIESNQPAHDWIESTRAWYYLPPNIEQDTKPKFKVLLGKVFQYSIE